MARRWALAVLAISCEACSSRTTLRLEVPDSATAKSMIIVVESEPQEHERRLAVLDLERDPDAAALDPSYDGTRATAVHALVYEQSTRELMLAPSVLQPITSGCRPLPVPRSIARANPSGSDATWSDGDFALLEDLRLPEPDLAACLGGGEGCVVFDTPPASLDECLPRDAICATPCPETQIFPPEPPLHPRAPILTPCPTGWIEDGAECRPPLRDDPLSCGRGEAQQFGTAGCRPIDPHCALMQLWPSELPAGRPVLYVRAGAAPNGDGTEAAPFATIAEAVAVAAVNDQTVLALADGEYAAPQEISSLAIYGACASRTVLAGDVSITGDSELSGITIRGGHLGVKVHPNAHAALQSLIISEQTAFGISIDHGTVVGSNVLIRNCDQNGVLMIGGTLALVGLNVETANRTAGESAVTIAGGGAASLSQLIIRDARRSALIVLDSTVTASGVDIIDAIDHGVRVSGPGARGTLHDVTVRKTAQAPRFRTGMAATGGAELDARVVSISGAESTGISADDGGSFLVIDQAFVGSTFDAIGRGVGVQVRADSRAELSRLLLEANGANGLFVAERASVRADDIIVRGGNNPGMYLAGSATATVSGALIEDTAGFWATGDALLHLDDASVTSTNTGFRCNGRVEAHVSRLFVRGGFGVSIEEDCGATLSHVEIDRARIAARFTAGRAIDVDHLRISNSSDGDLEIAAGHVELTDLTIGGVERIETAALKASEHVELELMRAHIDRPAPYGLESIGSEVRGRELTIEGADNGVHAKHRNDGTALGAVDLASFRIAHSRDAAVWIDLGSIDLHGGEIISNGCGITTAAEYPLYRVLDRVKYSSNDTAEEPCAVR